MHTPFWFKFFHFHKVLANIFKYLNIKTYSKFLTSIFYEKHISIFIHFPCVTKMYILLYFHLETSLKIKQTFSYEICNRDVLALWKCKAKIVWRYQGNQKPSF